MDVLRTAVSMLSLYDPLARDNSTEANQAKAKKLMAQTPTIVSTFDRLRNGKPPVEDDPSLGFAANFLYTLTGKRPDDVMEHTFDVALTLHADHELNASTFAARVTAATLSDIYSSVTSAIGALKGPLHGGANEDVIKLLLKAEDPDEAAQDGVANARGGQEDSGLRTSRVSHRGSARHASARALRGARQAHRTHDALPGIEARGADGERRKRSSMRTSISTRRPPTIRSAFRSICSRRSSPSAACPAGRRTSSSSITTTG